jgi:flagellar biosynthesis/type III secretory pathway M-ring protein FliF/YscJ
LNDPAIFWAAVGAVATVLALLVALVAVWPLIRTRRNRAKEAVISFMADLSMRHVLFEPVGVESPVPASTSLEEIRTGAAQLYGVLTDKRSKKAAAGIREASREAALAIRQERRMPGVPEPGPRERTRLRAREFSPSS